MFFKKIINKYSHKKSTLTKHNEKINQKQVTKNTVNQQLHKIIKQNPQFNKSSFYSSYIETMAEQMAQIFNPLVKKQSKSYQKQSIITYEKQLAFIILSLTNDGEILNTIINMWSDFCQFKFKEILQNNQNDQKQCQKQILNFFQKQFSLICFYIFKVCLFIYGKAFNQIKEFNEEKLFVFIRNSITICKQFSIIHNYIIKNIVGINRHCLEKESIQENTKEMDKLCKGNLIPIPFFQSLNLLKRFYREHVIIDKIQLGIKLISCIKDEITQYRTQNQMPGNYLITADDMFTVLAYLLWKTDRNVYGACAYIQSILYAGFQEVQLQIIAIQLEKVRDNARHSFETLKSVAQLGLIKEEYQHLL